MRFCCCFLLLILSAYTFADDIPKMYVLHINGIQTKRTEAENNRIALSKAVPVNSNMVEFGLVYNPTGDHPLLQDLEDVSRQKAAENKNLTLDDFTQSWIKTNDYPTDIYHPGTEQYAALESTILPKYKEILGYQGANFEEILNNFHDAVPPQFAFVSKLLNGVPGNYSNNKNYILLVPHSQGNLYANTLYTYLTEKEKLDILKIAIFGVATPAATNVGNWPLYDIANSYVTSQNDYIIKQVKLLAAPVPVLEPNTNIPIIASDILGHSLIDVYLKDQTSLEKIEKGINTALDRYILGIYMSVLNADLSELEQDQYLVLSNNINNEFVTAPITFMRDSQILYSNGKVGEGAMYYYNSPYSYNPMQVYAFYQKISGIYTINVSTSNDFNMLFLDTLVSWSTNIVSKNVMWHCLNDWLDPSVRTCTFNYYSGISDAVFFSYLTSDLPLMKESAPELFPTDGLMTVEEFNVE